MISPLSAVHIMSLISLMRPRSLLHVLHKSILYFLILFICPCSVLYILGRYYMSLVYSINILWYMSVVVIIPMSFKILYYISLVTITYIFLIYVIQYFLVINVLGLYYR